MLEHGARVTAAEPTDQLSAGHAERPLPRGAIRRLRGIRPIRFTREPPGSLRRAERRSRGAIRSRSAKIRDRAVSPQTGTGLGRSRGRSRDGVGTEWGRSGDGVNETICPHRHATAPRASARRRGRHQLQSIRLDVRPARGAIGSITPSVSSHQSICLAGSGAMRVARQERSALPIREDPRPRSSAPRKPTIGKRTAPR